MKKKENNRKISARREFYANIDEIKDLYNNKGFKFAKELYEHLNFKMSSWSFNHYFNKEIKNKNFHPTLCCENLNSKENEIIDNNSQNKHQIKKETYNEKENITTIEQPEISSDVYARYKKELADDVLGESIKNKEEIRKMFENKEK